MTSKNRQNKTTLFKNAYIDGIDGEIIKKSKEKIVIKAGWWLLLRGERGVVEEKHTIRGTREKSDVQGARPFFLFSGHCCACV